MSAETWPGVMGNVFGTCLKVLHVAEVQHLHVLWIWRLAKLAQNHSPGILERLKVVALARQFLEVTDVVHHLCAVSCCVVAEHNRR